MADAIRDDNRVTTMQGVSSVDGVTLVNIVIDSVTGYLLLSQSATGAHGAVTNRQVAVRDENRVTVMLGTSENDDGVLVQPVIEGGNLRIKSA